MVIRYIFLDIDGVLNSRITAELWKKLYPKLKPYGVSFREDDKFTKKDVMWSENAVEYLRRIVARTGASIVISSTWRKDFSLQKFKEMFALYGWQDAPVVGKTPVLSDTRGSEIDSYLTDNPCDAYLILDDDTDFTDYQKDNHFVWINFDCGLSLNQVDRCIEILME